MAESNGVAARGVSSFENDFREFNGRPPTPEEVKKHLAFDRLAKTSSLDPATLLLIVNGSGIDREAVIAQLNRIESMQKKIAATRPSTPIVAGPTRDLIVVAITVCVMVLVAVLCGVAAAPVTTLFAAFALGVGVALAYVYLAPMFTRK